MRLGVIGSRSFSGYAFFCSHLSKFKHDDLTIVSGGARGTDSLAQTYAKHNGLKILIVYPNWHKHERSAGFIRNQEVVNESTELITFWNGISPGTKNVIDIANRQKKKVTIIQI